MVHTHCRSNWVKCTAALTEEFRDVLKRSLDDFAQGHLFGSVCIIQQVPLKTVSIDG